MCLKVRFGQRIKVAKEHIVVYKTFGSVKPTHVISEYVGFKYLYGKVYSLGKKIVRSDYNDNHKEIDEGFHSFCDTSKTFFNCLELICIIPKGARYIKGTFDIYSMSFPSYVSDKIIVTRVKRSESFDVNKYMKRKFPELCQKN